MIYIAPKSRRESGRMNYVIIIIIEFNSGTIKIELDNTM